MSSNVERTLRQERQDEIEKHLTEADKCFEEAAASDSQALPDWRILSMLQANYHVMRAMLLKMDE